MATGGEKQHRSETLKSLEIPLTGKLRRDVDPLMLSNGDFQEITNLRYTLNHPRGILGMTKINEDATTYEQIDNIFNFRKDKPSESHLFLQTTDGSDSKILKSDNTADIPEQDTFSDFYTLSDASLVRFSDAPDGCMVACDGKSNMVWGGEEYRCASFIVFDDNAGLFWYDYTDKVTNTLTDATNIATLKTAAGDASVYIGSVRPIQGAKFYVVTANASAATAKAYYWDGSAWVEVTNLVDGTAVGGKSLAATGSISFDSTVGDAKLKYLKNKIIYFYKFVFSGLDDTTTVSYCTLDAPFQSIVDIWDGSARECLQFFKYTSSFSDYTTHVSKSDYYSGDPTTYAALDGLTSAQYLYLGFAERMMGFSITMPDASSVNTLANVISVDYWDGSQWTTVGTVDDSTSTGGKSFNHSGVVVWTAPDENTEFQTSQANEDLYYYYRVHFDNTLATPTRIDLAYGIPAQKPLVAHRFSQLWRGRTWLFDDQSRDRNSGICSAFNTVCTFNGQDSTRLYFGNNEACVASAALFTRYGSSLYENMVVFKKKGIYLVDGNTLDDWVKYTYTVSDDIGCVAPKTLQKCDVSYEVAPGITKHVLIFQSARGIEYFDGNALTPISEDIRCFFDPFHAEYINNDLVEEFSSFYDPKYYEYHWLFATGTSTTLNREMVYDLRKKKWYEIDRGTGKALRCGTIVDDSHGNKYNYAGTIDGFIERLENGTTFDGNDMDFSFRLGDSPLAGSVSYVSRIRHVKFIGVAKNTSANTVTLTHYGDTATTGTAITGISQKNASGRVYQIKRSVPWLATIHSIGASVSTDDELVGFEPLAISLLFTVEREDL